MAGELTVENLYKICDSAAFGGKDSSEIDTLQTIIGQERAVRALRFGLAIREDGFNIYVAGRAGTGRIRAIERFLKEVAAPQPTPSDSCYVNDFHDSYRPRVMLLPAGQAVKFRADMEKFIGRVAQEIRKAFEGEDYGAHRDEVNKKIEEQKRRLLEDLNEQALKVNFSLQASPAGLLTIPMRGTTPITEEEFVVLKTEERERITKTRQGLETTIESVLRQVKGLDKDAADAIQ